MVMLYKLGNHIEIEGVKYEYAIVSEEEVYDKLAEGWYLTTTEAKKVDSNDDGDITREELEFKAKELGIKFDGRMSDKTLLAKIEEKLGE
jgi:hypothetical protein